ncbi:MAG: hypothetical protein KatS3mg031_2041 [Chitinophagales bacterium]|nr:MAG: hypothetical protein KatS3mg031_2041 [Chitinophagales bacterium]
MKICLIRPPRFMVDGAITMRPAAPLGLALVAASLREAGHEVMVVDGVAEAPDQLNRIEADYMTNGLSVNQIIARVPHDADVIGFSCMFSMNWIQDRKLIDAVGDHFPQTLIIAGGEHITAAPEISLRQTRHLHVCVLGEGEETVVDLVNAWEQKRDFSTVPGIVYKKPDGALCRTGKRTRIRQIEDIPWPAWDLFPLETYHEKKMVFGVVKNRSLPLLASRGCPYSCTFCSSPQMWGTRYYIRSPQNVADEIEYFHYKYRIDNFDFFDLTAILKKEWVVEFAKEILKRKLNITWQLPAGTRSEAIDRECARYLYLSGCRHLSYAPESGSKRILKLIKKKVNLENMLQSMKYANKEKLHLRLNMIFGFPDDTHLDIWKTMWFLVRCSWVGAHEIGPSAFQPYPGSALFNRLEQEGKINMNDDRYFYEMVRTDEFFGNTFYNDHISVRWLQFYQVLGIVVFYGSNYLFRPARFFRLVKGIVTKQYNSKLEVSLAELLTRSRSGVKRVQTASN